MKRVLYLEICFLILFPAVICAAENSSVRLGPVFLNQIPADWTRDRDAEINYEARFISPDKKVESKWKLEPITEFENQWEGEQLLSWLHENWLLEKANEKASSQSCPNKFKSGVRCYEIEQDDQNQRRIYRLYRYFPEVRLVLTAMLESQSPISEKALISSAQMMTSSNADPKQFFSPCVRLGLIKEKFERFASARKNEIELIQKFKISLEKEMMAMIEQHPHHHPAVHYYMLGFLASYNEQGIFLGPGFPRESAVRYYERAHQLDHESMDPEDALRILKEA